MVDDDGLLGALIVDGRGGVIGRAAALLVDPQSLDARWLLVRLPDESSAVLPSAVASVDAAGRLVVPYTLDTVAHAPHVGDEVVSEQIASELLRYYGFSS